MLRGLASASRYAAALVCAGTLSIGCTSTAGSPVVLTAGGTTAATDTAATGTAVTITDADPIVDTTGSASTGQTTSSPSTPSSATSSATPSSSPASSTTTGQTTTSTVDPVAFCANPGKVEMTYASGSTPPPYHYEWTFTVSGTNGSLAFRAGYAPDQQTWTETFSMPDGDAAKICQEIIDIVQSSDEDPTGSVGGPHGSATIVTESGSWSQQVGSGSAAALQDTMSTGYIPFDAWDAVHLKFQEYQDKATN